MIEKEKIMEAIDDINYNMKYPCRKESIKGQESVSIVHTAYLEQAEESKRLKDICVKQEYTVWKILSDALEYPTVDGLPTSGEHTAESLAMEAAKELEVRKRAFDIMDKDVWERFEGIRLIAVLTVKEAIKQARREIGEGGQ